MHAQPLFDATLIHRYDGSGPRYTSYPTAAQFTSDIGEGDYIEAVGKTNEFLIPAALSLYIHVPFCDTVCYYCGCNKIVTKNKKHAEMYVEYLLKEIAMHAALYDKDREVWQLHFGGGTPTFLTTEQFDVIFNALRENFNLSKDPTRDFSIELDPRAIEVDDVFYLAGLGFNRFSIGVQDTSLRVQSAVNRIQSIEDTLKITGACRVAGAQSINVDLIYGLPHQTALSFTETLNTVISYFKPDRLSIFNYAHLPERFKTQRHIDAATLPSPEQKLQILEAAISRVAAAGYIHIGMDHFALPDDPLVAALENKTLHRNFQGYSTYRGSDLIALGVSAIGKPGNFYAQNAKRLDDYYSLIDKGKIPIERGYELSPDDCLRAEIIQQLSCYYELSVEALENQSQLNVQNYFAWELAQLDILQRDGLLQKQAGSWQVTAKGRLLIRNICAVFDRYQQPANASGFSRLI